MDRVQTQGSSRTADLSTPGGSIANSMSRSKEAITAAAFLTLILSKIIKFPNTGNPHLYELLVHMRGSARAVTDEAIERAVHAVGYVDRPQLFAALGGAVLVGWGGTARTRLTLSRFNIPAETNMTEGV
jgi:hypothetical protein